MSGVPSSETSRERGRDLDASLARYGPPAAAGLVVLALVLRLPGMLGWWVNPDEGIYLTVVTQESFRLFWAEAFATAHPPLYFVLLRAMAWLGTDVTWLRSLALVSGCAAVWLFVLLGRDLGGPSARGWIAGLTAGFLLAVSPEAIVASQVIRPYMLLVSLLALTVHFLLRYLERPSRWALVAYTLCASLAALLHYSAVLALGVMALLILADGIARGPARREWRHLLAAQVLPGAIVGVLYLTHIRQLMASDVAEFSVTTWLAGYLIRTPADVWRSIVGFHSGLVGPVASVAATLITLAAIATAVASRTHHVWLAVAGSLAIATVGAAIELYPFGAARHSAWLLPFVVPGMAWLLASAVTAGDRVPRRIAIVGVVLAAGLLLRAPLGAGRVEPGLPEHGLRNEHVAALSEVLDPDSPPRLVVMSVETYRLMAPLYLRERQHARTSADGYYFHFPWGARDVLVLPSLDLAVRRDQMWQPNHLYEGTRKAAAELGVAPPEDGEPVLVLSGDWRGSVYELAEIARQADLAGEIQVIPGLMAVTLDFEAYGRALRSEVATGLVAPGAP